MVEKAGATNRAKKHEEAKIKPSLCALLGVEGSPRGLPCPGPSAGLGGGRVEGGLGLEVAGAVAVEAALGEAEAVADGLLEHLALHGADGGVGLGQLEVGAGVLAEDRQLVGAADDLGLDAAVVEDRAELDEAALPGVAGEL